MENCLKDSVIGQVAYVTMYKVKTGKMFTVKCHTYGIEDSTLRELSCLATLKGHPFVIQMSDCFVDDAK